MYSSPCQGICQMATMCWMLVDNDEQDRVLAANKLIVLRRERAPSGKTSITTWKKKKPTWMLVVDLYNGNVRLICLTLDVLKISSHAFSLWISATTQWGSLGKVKLLGQRDCATGLGSQELVMAECGLEGHLADSRLNVLSCALYLFHPHLIWSRLTYPLSLLNCHFFRKCWTSEWIKSCYCQFSLPASSLASSLGFYTQLITISNQL